MPIAPLPTPASPRRSKNSGSPRRSSRESSSGDAEEDHFTQPHLKAVCRAFKSAQECRRSQFALHDLLQHVSVCSDLLAASRCFPSTVPGRQHLRRWPAGAGPSLARLDSPGCRLEAADAQRSTPILVIGASPVRRVAGSRIRGLGLVLGQWQRSRSATRVVLAYRQRTEHPHGRPAVGRTRSGWRTTSRRPQLTSPLNRRCAGARSMG